MEEKSKQRKYKQTKKNGHTTLGAHTPVTGDLPNPEKHQQPEATTTTATMLLLWRAKAHDGDTGRFSTILEEVCLIVKKRGCV